MHLVSNTDTVRDGQQVSPAAPAAGGHRPHFHPAVLFGCRSAWPWQASGGAVAAERLLVQFRRDARHLARLGSSPVLCDRENARWLVDYFVVTQERMVMVTGFFTRDVVSVPMVHATHIKLRRSILGRIIGYGQFIIEADRIQPGWTAEIHALPGTALPRDNRPGLPRCEYGRRPGSEVAATRRPSGRSARMAAESALCRRGTSRAPRPG